MEVVPDDRELTIEELEAVYLRSLRLVVQRQVEANTGLTTANKTKALGRANRLSQAAQHNVLAVYIKDEQAKDPAAKPTDTIPVVES